MSKPSRLAISFKVPQDGVLEHGMLLAYKPVPVNGKSIKEIEIESN